MFSIEKNIEAKMHWKKYIFYESIKKSTLKIFLEKKTFKKIVI